MLHMLTATNESCCSLTTDSQVYLLISKDSHVENFFFSPPAHQTWIGNK